MTRRSASSRAAARLPLFALAAAMGTFTAFAAENAEFTEDITTRAEEIFHFNRIGVVKIQASDPHGLMEGTGFYADSSGTIYTGVDVIGDGSNITVIQGMRKMPARVEVADPRSRVAIIKVDTTTPFLPIGDSSSVEPYTPLVTIGYPFDKEAIWNAGIVASLDKQYLPDRFFPTTLIRAKIPVKPGFGGAPVLNLKGEVVGIVMAGVDGNNACYVLPINAAEKIRSDFKRFDRIRPGWAGISVTASKETSQPSTVQVSTIHPDSPAGLAGLHVGDILLRVGDVVLRTPEDIFDASFYLTAGDETTVTILRDGKEQQITFRPMDNPSDVAAAKPGAPSEEESHTVLQLNTIPTDASSVPSSPQPASAPR